MEVFTVELIAIAGMGANPAAVSSQRQLNPLSIGAHPAHLMRGYTHHQREGFHVPIDHRTGTHKSVMSDTVATDNRAICAKRGPTLHPGFSIFILPRNSRAWVVYVGKNHAWPAENVVFEGYVVVHRHIVLNLHVVADVNAIAYKYVLPQRAVLADHGTCANMHPVPDAAVCADIRTLINEGRGVNCG